MSSALLMMRINHHRSEALENPSLPLGFRFIRFRSEANFFTSSVDLQRIICDTEYVLLCAPLPGR